MGFLNTLQRSEHPSTTIDSSARAVVFNRHMRCSRVWYLSWFCQRSWYMLCAAELPIDALQQCLFDAACCCGQVTGFSNSEEKAVGRADAIAFCLEDALTQVCALVLFASPIHYSCRLSQRVCRSSHMRSSGFEAINRAYHLRFHAYTTTRFHMVRESHETTLFSSIKTLETRSIRMSNQPSIS